MKETSQKKEPCAVDVKAGNSYFWCACGESNSQPFCDGSHKGSAHNPLIYKALENKTIYFCMCKKSGSPPFCDGSHSE